MPLFKKSPRCPNCGEELEAAPKRKSKCPHCSEFIFVDHGELLTKKQVEETRLKNRWFRALEQLGATEKMFSEEREKLSAQFGFEAGVADVLWRIMNKLIPEQTKSSDLESLYLRMGQFLTEEGKDPVSFIAKAKEIQTKRLMSEVRGYKRTFDETPFSVGIQTSRDEVVCEECRSASKRKYTADEFLELMPIPGPCSSDFGCRCWVSARVEFAD